MSQLSVVSAQCPEFVRSGFVLYTTDRQVARFLKHVAKLLILRSLFAAAVMAQSRESPFGDAVAKATSLKGDIYYLPVDTSSLPDFSRMTTVGSIYTRVLDIPERSFDSGFPGVTDRFEWFAIRYSGRFEIRQAGGYGFRLVSDDGSRLFIDGKKVIDNDGLHPTSSASGTTVLSRGVHTIEVDYFQGPRYEVALGIVLCF